MAERNLNPARRSLSVLVAEDESSLARLLEQELTKAGHIVTVTPDGREALKALYTHKYDAAVLDVMMPYIDGIEVVKAIRADEQLAELPVIILTAKAEDRDVFDGYHSGADLYLTKPCEASDILIALDRLVPAAE